MCRETSEKCGVVKKVKRGGGRGGIRTKNRRVGIQTGGEEGRGRTVRARKMKDGRAGGNISEIRE